MENDIQVEEIQIQMEGDDGSNESQRRNRMFIVLEDVAVRI